MRLAALFSGGKDSTYAVQRAQERGDTVECLVTLAPASPASMLLHYPNTRLTRLQAESMKIPHVYVESGPETGMELASLHSVLGSVRQEYDVDGLVHGGIMSRFQRDAFEKVCGRVGLRMVSPVWNVDQVSYMRMLVDSRYTFIIASVSAGGMDSSWLGTAITMENLPLLEQLSERFGFNISFEGGEAETLVLDCPLFAAPLSVSGTASWDGYRGRFEIEEAFLDYSARRSQRQLAGGDKEDRQLLRRGQRAYKRALKERAEGPARS